MNIRKATINDVNAIVQLLADDKLGKKRERHEHPTPEEYLIAFKEIEEQIGNDIILAVQDHTITGCLQLTIIPGLARLGMKRAQIEGVRVARDYRGKGIGEVLIKEAIIIAKQQGVGLIQLTTDKTRADAHRFYEKLGFAATHEGMKLEIT